MYFFIKKNYKKRKKLDFLFFGQIGVTSDSLLWQEPIFQIKLNSGNKNKGKGSGAGLAWENQSHCFADEFVITHAHSFGTDTHHDNSQGNCRTMSIIIKLVKRVVYGKL